MGSNAGIDIAIGLILMYLILSLIGTVLNEFVATLCKIRASTLKNALAEILDNPALRADFYNHGLIDGTNKAISGKVSGNHASYLSGETFALAVIGSLDPTKPIPGFSDVKTAMENLPDCNIRDALLAQLTTANGSLDTLRTNIASYFDTAMDRVSGTYQRYLKWISLGVGIVVVGLINADTIAVGAALWKDSSLRAQMVQNATALQANPPDQACKDRDAASSIKTLNCLEDDIRPLPIGWHAVPSGFWSWVAKILGLVFSALAVSLGAPFWFDMLSKFMNVRGAGTKPQRTKTS